MQSDNDANPYRPTDSKATAEAIDAGEFLCKNCGCKSFHRVKPEARFAFAKDYQCVECREQIPAPVPLWGALTMLFGGLLLVPVGGLLMLSNAFAGRIIGILLGVAILVFGVKFAAAGVSELRG